MNIQVKSTWMEKVLYHSNSKFNKASMVILIPDTIEFRTKKKKSKNRHSTMIKVLTAILICMCLIREIKN